MTVLGIAADGIEARVSTRGGRILGLAWRNAAGQRVPVLCEADEGAGSGDRSAFALMPFGNRLEGNVFRFGDRDHRLAPNAADPCYLHGDGWLGDWGVEAADADGIRLGFRQETGPYVYAAHQEIGIAGGTLRIVLSVENRGDAPMPFGLGWHPFLPRTPQTRIEMRARGFRTERPGHLAGEPAPPPADLDFAGAAPLPDRWVNNGLEDWDGKATIVWPERGAGVSILADPVFAHAFLFLPDRGFAPHLDWFCLEPMTHRAGAHHQPDLGGLAVLSPGARLAGALRLAPFSLDPETAHR